METSLIVLITAYGRNEFPSSYPQKYHNVSNRLPVTNSGKKIIGALCVLTNTKPV